MDIFGREAFTELVEHGSKTCVSIYLETHRAGPGIQQDSIRLKNLLVSAEEQLLGTGMRPAVARKLMEPGRRLHEDETFWRNQSDGLAVFVAPEFFRFYRLAYKFDELALVSGRFHVKPLLSILEEGGEYYVLALSQKRVRLIQGTKFGAVEMDLEGVPQGLADALGLEEEEKQLQFHTRAQGTIGERAAMFHGHGVSKDYTKDRIIRYFRKVDEGVQRLVKNSGAPLIVAAVEYLLPLYSEVNTYAGLLTSGITGNPDELPLEELHSKARILLEPTVRQQQQQAAEQFRGLLGTGKASTFPGEIVPASYQGRVATLLIVSGRHQWGVLDPSNAGAVSRFCEVEGPGCEDLYDLAAVQTLLHGGKVYTLDNESIHDGSDIAAVYRY